MESGRFLADFNRITSPRLIQPPPAQPVAAHSGANSPRCAATPGVLGKIVQEVILALKNKGWSQGGGYDLDTLTINPFTYQLQKHPETSHLGSFFFYRSNPPKKTMV